MNNNAISWFEIPVTDFARAKKFYGEILKAEIHETMMGEYQMGFLPCNPELGVGGAIVLGEGYIPSQNGSKVYLNGNPDLGVILDRVPTAGGKVVIPKSLISEDIGYFASFEDSEGNVVFLHSV